MTCDGALCLLTLQSPHHIRGRTYSFTPNYYIKPIQNFINGTDQQMQSQEQSLSSLLTEVTGM